MGKTNKNIEEIKFRRLRIMVYLFIIASAVITTTKWFVRLFYGA